MAFYATSHMRFLRAASCSIGASPLQEQVHPVWQMRIKLRRSKTGYVTRSCKTKSYDEAHAIAEDEFFRARNRGLGMAFR